jgi:hypothetical protein
MIDLTSLLENSVMGVLLGWFMFRMEKVIKNNTEILILVKDKITRK